MLGESFLGAFAGGFRPGDIDFLRPFRGVRQYGEAVRLHFQEAPGHHQREFLGATVVGTTSTEEKAELVREAGADHVILYTQTDFESETKRLTEGRGVDVVYDSVGKTTFEKSLNVLRLRGMLALFGQSSGKVPPIDPLILNAKGSLFLTRPTVFHYTATRDELLWRSGDVFNWIAAGELKIRIERQLPLAEAAEAHRLLESRQTAGKLLLIP